MQKLTRLSFLILFLAVASSCGNANKKDGGGSISDKKADLQKLKSERQNLGVKIDVLEKEIAKVDTTGGAKETPKLVSIEPLKLQDFKHYLDLQGVVDPRNISYVTPKTSGLITSILVKQGDHVSKGQLVARLDNSMATQNVAAIKQQLVSIRAQLGLARSVYQRQQNLWDQHIGTEVLLLQDKTNVESLEGQLKAVQAQVNSAQTQANQSYVYSDVNGACRRVFYSRSWVY
jgi:membrane fusion protein (multidrug efflux system)